MKLIERIRLYWSPARRIARKLRACQRIAEKHNFTVAITHFGDEAEEFEDFEP